MRAVGIPEGFVIWDERSCMMKKAATGGLGERSKSNNKQINYG